MLSGVKHKSFCVALQLEYLRFPLSNEMSTVLLKRFMKTINVWIINITTLFNARVGWSVVNYVFPPQVKSSLIVQHTETVGNLRNSQTFTISLSLSMSTSLFRVRNIYL